MTRKIIFLYVLIALYYWPAQTQPLAEQFYNQGMNLMAFGDITCAEVNFSKALEYNENFAEAYIQRGLVRWYLNKFGDAMRDYNRAFELKPELIKAKRNIRDIFRSLLKITKI